MTGGIVLAGGRSTRMGADKATLEVGGEALVVRTARVVAGAVGGPVVVVAAAGQQLPAGLEIVRDAEPGRGPLEGLLAGLRALEGRADSAYVCAVDLPWLSAAAVHRVTGALVGADAAVPVVAGVRQPLAAAYRVAIADAVEARLATGAGSVMGLLETLRVVEVAADDLAAQLRDADVPADLT